MKSLRERQKRLRCKIDKVSMADAEDLGLCWACDPTTRIPCRERLETKPVYPSQLRNVR